MFFLNIKIFTFHDLIIFTELIDKQQPLFKLLYMCGGEGYLEISYL